VGISYWKEVAPGRAFLNDVWDRHDLLFYPARFPTINEVRSKWMEVESEQIDFLNGLTNESLEKMLPIRTTEISLGNLLQHLANHPWQQNSTFLQDCRVQAIHNCTARPSSELVSHQIAI
jgi:hypothetical protein